MKRIAHILILGSLLGALQALASCSSPLQSDRVTDPDLTPGDSTMTVDTVFIVDTVTLVDTVIQIDSALQIDTIIQIDTIGQTDTLILVDTIIIYDTTNTSDTVTQVDTVNIIDTVTSIDTLIVLDTVSVVDTVYVNEDDSSGVSELCGRLNSSRKEIVWLLQNDSGQRHLEFEAHVDGDKPPKKLKIVIDGQEFIWDLRENLEFEIDFDLSSDAVITITPLSPASYGHAVDICLEIEAI